MTDLHCPATLLVARHGDADYAHAHVMSDDGGWLTPKGRDQVAALTASLHTDRVAAVRTSRLERAVESGVLAAGGLGVVSTELDGLEEIRVGDCAGLTFADPAYQDVLGHWFAGELDERIPGGESGEDVVGRFRDALLAIADQHRGETVLVFTHGGVMSVALPRLAANTRDDLARDRFLPNAVPARVEVGDGGFTILHWPGSADRAVV